MYNSKYISIKEIADRIKRGRLFTDLPFESIVDYAVDVMKLIVNEKYFVTLPAIIEINEFKGALPCGFEYIKSCSKYDVKSNSYTQMRPGTDNFHTVYNKVGNPSSSNLTYDLNNDVIFPNFQKGKLFIVYKAIPVSEEGYPMIPDNVNVKLAVENYIKYNYLRDMAPEENVTIRAMSDAEQDYLWYVGKSRAAATNMTLDEMETFANSMSQLFTDPMQFSERMEHLGNQEFLKIK